MPCSDRSHLPGPPPKAIGDWIGHLLASTSPKRPLCFDGVEPLIAGEAEVQRVVYGRDSLNETVLDETWDAGRRLGPIFDLASLQGVAWLTV